MELNWKSATGITAESTKVWRLSNRFFKVQWALPKSRRKVKNFWNQVKMETTYQKPVWHTECCPKREVYSKECLRLENTWINLLMLLKALTNEKISKISTSCNTCTLTSFYFQQPFLKFWELKRILYDPWMLYVIRITSLWM